MLNKTYLILFIFFNACTTDNLKQVPSKQEYTQKFYYNRMKYFNRVRVIDSLITFYKINLISKQRDSISFAHINNLWVFPNKTTINLSLNNEAMLENINFFSLRVVYEEHNLRYEDSLFRSNNEIKEGITYRKSLKFGYSYDKKIVLYDGDSFQRYIADSIIHNKKYNINNLSQWQKISVNEGNNLDTFLELWNPKLKRLDKVEEWDAWYEKTHRE